MGRYVYVVHDHAGSPISVIDPTTNTVIKNITGVPGFPRIAYENSGPLYVGSETDSSSLDIDNGTVSVIDTSSNTPQGVVGKFFKAA